MKVVVITHNSAGHLGGAELSLLAILDRWVELESDVEPIVVSPAPARAFAREVRERGWRSIELSYSGWALYDVDGGRAAQRLRDRENATATAALLRLLVEEQPSVVLTNTVIAPWGAIAAAAVGIPHVWFVREFAHPDQGVHIPTGRDEALADVGRLSHRVVANSFAVRDELARYIPEERLDVVYPPVDLERVRRAAMAPPLETVFQDPDALHVTVVGRVTRSKGQWRVVEAAGELARRGYAIEIVFVGEVLDHRADAIMLRRARALHIDGRVRFVGEQSNPVAYAVAADVCITPSDREAFGRSTLECLAAGRPVVSTREGAGAELILAGETGELFDAADPRSLADRLELYVRDPARAEWQGAAARRHADILVAGERSLDAAVGIIGDSRAAGAAVLPQRWATWLDRLDDTARSGSVPLLRTLAFGASLARKGGRALRHPRRAARRFAAVFSGRRRTG